MPVPQHHDNRLLATLSREALTLIEPALNEAPISPGTVLLEPGEPIRQVYFPQSGMISLLVVTKDGDTVETSTIGREGALGLRRGFGERRSFTRATVQIAGRFSTIAADAFEDIALRSVAVREMIVRYTEVLLAEAQQIAACNAVHDASSRLCRWLLQSADRIGSSQLPMTQDFLAQMLGVRRTTVTLLAQELQKKGAIKYSRGRMIILDRKALERCSCECYRVMQSENLPVMIGVARR
jgi:CRP-like cAMP-binding protein